MRFGPLDNAKIWTWVGIGVVMLLLVWIAWAAS
jgi:hypothetical protein